MLSLADAIGHILTEDDKIFNLIFQHEGFRTAC